MANDVVFSPMESMLKKRMLKFQVSQTMFCPGCKNILDCKRAVSLDFYRGEHLAGTKCVCTSCYDAKMGAGKLEAQLQGTGLRLEVTDGRQLFSRKGGK